MGAETQAFEEEFAQAIGARHAIAVTNATAALHLACVACGIGPGDEVIVPSLTFVATANAVRYVGASPVFADIQGESDLTISPQSIEARLSTRTRAIIVMHYAGFACDMPAIMKLADRYGLCVIEDAAHAAGSSLEGRSLGTWGAVGCFSFFSNKNMTTGEGGMLVTQDDELAAKLRSLRSHGMTTMT
jgi:dTDP-4-amino-4,6-dideoxygalactose transaminase